MQGSSKIKSFYNYYYYPGINYQDQEMIRMVPTNSKLQNSDFDPNHSLQQFKVEASPETDLDLDFDLGYLTSSDCGKSDLDVLSPFSSSCSDGPFQPGSPSGSEQFSPDLDSLTMFSPSSNSKYGGNGGANQQGYALSPPCHVPSASPLSMAPSSPYSPPGCRPSIRFSSTDTMASSNSSSAMNFQENLEEFAELQRNYNPDQQSGSVVVEDTKLASVLSTVLDDLFEHVRLEIKTQCSLLNINPDPSSWSSADVARWLRYKMQELKIPDASSSLVQWAAKFEGPGFVQITEDEFKARLPQGGDQIYNALAMWRNAALQDPTGVQQQPPRQEELYHVDDVLAMMDNEAIYNPPQYSKPPPSFEAHMQANSNNSSLTSRMPSIDELLQQQEPVTTVVVPPPPPYPGTTLTTLQPPMSQASSTHEATEDEEADEQEENQDVRAPGGGPIRGSSSNIHLWQFVKELLNQSQHSGCIHWVDREQGIFKIVDSVRVAELWGKRKNRPAMNFDKLSRSLRQYYKKGIMKKTSRPQRLVYQFVAPYHL